MATPSIFTRQHLWIDHRKKVPRETAKRSGPFFRNGRLDLSATLRPLSSAVLFDSSLWCFFGLTNLTFSNLAFVLFLNSTSFDLLTFWFHQFDSISYVLHLFILASPHYQRSSPYFSKLSQRLPSQFPHSSFGCLVSSAYLLYDEFEIEVWTTSSLLFWEESSHSSDNFKMKNLQTLKWKICKL